MASSYPTVLDNLPTTRTDGTAMAVNHAQDHNNADDAINKIEAELGLVPKGLFSSVRARLDALDQPALNTQTASYTLALSDFGKIVGINSGSANTLFVPTDAAVTFPIGTQILIRQVGAGTTTVTAVTPTTTAINSRGQVRNLAGQYAYATLVKVGTNSWELSGDLA